MLRSPSWPRSCGLSTHLIRKVARGPGPRAPRSNASGSARCRRRWRDWSRLSRAPRRRCRSTGCRTSARRLCLGAPASAVPKPSTTRTRPSRAFCRAAARVACAGAPHRRDAPADQRHASSRLVWGDGPASGRQWLLSPATTTAQRITAAGGGWSATSLIVGFLSATWSTTGLRRPPLPLRKGPFLLPPRLQLAGADGSAITCLSAAD